MKTDFGDQMPIYVFADVDETVIASRRTRPPEGGRPVATDSRGAVCGYLTPKQERLLGFLRAGATFVPTTARSTDAFRRLDLDFSGWAILSFGGVILTPEGTVEPRWAERITDGAACHRESLHRLAAQVVETAGREKIDVRSSIVSDAGMDLYASVKHNGGDADALTPVYRMLLDNLPTGWRLHFNLNLISILPPFLGKELAVKWFLTHIAPPGVITVGAGDSLTDVPFMGLCDYALVPTRSQNFRRLAKEVPDAIVSR